MSGTPFASLHHNIYPLMMRVLVDMNWLFEYVELGRGTCETTLATVATVAFIKHLRKSLREKAFLHQNSPCLAHPHTWNCFKLCLSLT